MVHVTLNRDVYAYLVTFLSSPKDLLAVCLANKEFKDLAEPEMVYRHISCRLDHTALWEHLAKNPGPASRVRKLEIQRQNPSGYGSHLVAPSREIYPNSSYLATGRRLLTDDHTPASVERAENLLVQAVRNMVNLESFIWDRWVPFINQGDDVFHSDGQDNAGSSVYSDDIWTVLRERTKIDYLKVVDLGQLNQIFSPCRPIFNSTLFTIRNLVVLDLKIYYSPDSDTFDAEDLARGRVKVERIKELLRYCPNLESLSLAILDRPFYFDFEGNPYTNITPVIAGGYWPRLTSLQLRDITVDDIAMILFLRRHPSLRKLSASLSLTEEDGPPLVPFSFESHETSIRGILPNLEYVDLPAAVLRPYLRTARRPTNLRAIQHLESGDWTTAEESVIDSDFLTSLDDVWGPGPGEDERENTNEAAVSDAQQIELLAGMPKLRMLSLAYISTLKQLDKLYQLTPDLEHLVIVDPLVRYDVRLKRHEEILLYVSRWKHLVSFRGPCFWTQEMEPNDHANEVSAIACDIVAACPNLRYLSWLNGQTVEISKSETGEFLGLDIVYLPSFFGQA